MEEELIVTESLRETLIDISSSIKEDNPPISKKGLKKRLRKNFHQYIGKQFSVDKNEEMNSFLKDGHCPTEELTDFSRTYSLERITQQHIEYYL